MIRNLFVDKKSLLFSFSRYFYDDLRYNRNYFVHRKTFLKNVIIINNQYFHVTWRNFFIQKQDPVIDDSIDFKLLQKDLKYTTQQKFIELLVKKDEKIYQNRMKKQFGKVFDPFQLLLSNQQTIIELFYLSPINLDEENMIGQIEKIFLGNLDDLNCLFKNIIQRNINKKTGTKIKTNNLNLYDLGIISTLESKDIFNINDFTKNHSIISEIDYKLIIWKLLSSSCDLFESIPFDFILPMD